ncbi:MAG: hypothetical protein KC519_02845, partial [Anaerolineae bacterium]|nr:hypothetical protein [Anaerolineae bacterium]
QANESLMNVQTSHVANADPNDTLRIRTHVTYVRIYTAVVKRTRVPTSIKYSGSHAELIILDFTADALFCHQLLNRLDA